MSPLSPTALAIVGIAALILFFGSSSLFLLCLTEKLKKELPAAAFLFLLSFLFLQLVTDAVSVHEEQSALFRVASSFAVWPSAVLIAIFLGLLCGVIALWLRVRLEREDRMTVMSVKAAVDSLPSGLLFYLPGGRVLLVNRVMEELCRKTLSLPAANGEVIRERLFFGSLKENCEFVRAGDSPVVILPEGKAFSLHERESVFREVPFRMLFAAEVTELYRKTRTLREMQEKLTRLNSRLTDYNREIVALTAQRELLEARIRLHDEMGADLLTIRKYILEGGSGKEREEIESRLRRNVTFLKTGHSLPVRDEYELMEETARKLGICLKIQGTLPREEPFQHVIATAIHETLTNTIRHARGSEVSVTISETEKEIRAVFTNDGEAPAGEIREGGGLTSLRKLTEQAGGEMLVLSDPVFSVTLILPKEAYDVL